MIEAVGVGVSLGGARVLRGCDVAVQPGRVVALVGPNGAGKSTLLGALAGLRPVDEGSITVLGRDARAHAPAELARLRAFVPQRGEAAFDFTVLEAVRLGRFAGPGGGASPADDEAARRSLARVGCAGLEGRRLTSLSGGEQQRVRLARALAQLDAEGAREPGPRALLLDEPFAGLDLAHQLLVRRLLRSLAAEGLAVALAAHELALVAEVADELVALTRGEPPVRGAPAEVLQEDVLLRVFGVRGRLECGALRLEEPG